LKVLAVGDLAVDVYVIPSYSIVNRYNKEQDYEALQIDSGSSKS